ncbi:MAG: hypothetical protein OHK0013_25250 [Sandaracinaceae bacterium]
MLATSALVPLALAGGFVAPPSARTQNAPPAASGRTEAQLRELLAGAWHLVQSEEVARRTVDRGIERAVSEMNYFVQSVARDQMRANTPVNRRIDIAFEGTSRITITFDQRFTYPTRPGVQQQFSLPDGGSVQVRQYFRDGALEQYFEASLGRRWNVYRLSDDGQTMTVAATQQGPMMPVPMYFQLDYRKR